MNNNQKSPRRPAAPAQGELLTVDREAPLLEWLQAKLPHMSRSKLKAVLQGRGITVDRRVVTQFDHALRPGQKVCVSRSKRDMALKSRWVRVVYEDQWLVVVEKQAGILSMAAGHSSLTVKAVLDEYFERTRQKCRAHVVHRLDRDTSGLMIYAKSREVEQALEADWHTTVYDRRYVALLSGVMADDEGTMSSYLKDNAAYITFSSFTDNGGKWAVTHFRVLQRSRQHTLAEFQLETGRKNQIRVHASDMGHPVCGDVKYGNGDDPLGRLCLHAYVLCFTHPVTKKPLEFSTAIPTAFRKALEGKC